MKKLSTILVMLVVALSSATAASRSVVFGWAPSAEPDLAGYIFYERVGAEYIELGVIDPSPRPTCAVRNITRGTHYYSVTAFDTDGLESDYSDEVQYTRGKPR